MKRSEIDKKYLWSLEDVYADDDAWEKDYTDMKDDMIFGDKPTFDELIDMMKTLQEKFRKIQ